MQAWTEGHQVLEWCYDRVGWQSVDVGRHRHHRRRCCPPHRLHLADSVSGGSPPSGLLHGDPHHVCLCGVPYFRSILSNDVFRLSSGNNDENNRESRFGTAPSHKSSLLREYTQNSYAQTIITSSENVETEF